MNGLFKADANAFPKLRPTDKHTINPGPAVDATASISLIFLNVYQLKQDLYLFLP